MKNKPLKPQDSVDDINHKLRSSSKERLNIFREIPENNQGFILLGLSKKLQEKILHELSNQEIINVINFLDPDEATDILQNVNSHRRAEVINKLSGKIKEKIEYLIKFNPKTAAGIMSLDYVEVEERLSFDDVSKIIKKHEKVTGKFPAILVVKNGLLVGEILSHTLVLAKRTDKIKNSIKKISTINFDADKEKVIKIFKSHPHNKVVVLDEKKAIMGLIYSDDILRVIDEHPSKDLFDFAGVSREEDVYDSVFSKVKHRYKWLILNLATAFLAASVVSLFQNTISSFVLLAVYMPIIAGMGGNTGTQTLAVMVRGIALKEIELNTGMKVILKEMGSGVINGIIIGVIVTIIATIFNQNPLLGLIVGISMVINLSIAGLFGSTIPLVMKKLGKDPATSAAIFITTATDLFGFFIFLGLASIVF